MDKDMTLQNGSPKDLGVIKPGPCLHVYAVQFVLVTLSLGYFPLDYQPVWIHENFRTNDLFLI